MNRESRAVIASQRRSQAKPKEDRGDLFKYNGRPGATQTLPSRNKAFLDNFSLGSYDARLEAGHEKNERDQIRSVMSSQLGEPGFSQAAIGTSRDILVRTPGASSRAVHKQRVTLIGAGADGWVFRTAFPFGDIAIKVSICSGDQGYYYRRELRMMQRATQLANRGIPHVTRLLGDAENTTAGMCSFAMPLAMGDVSTGLKNGDLTKSMRCFISVVQQCVLSVYIFHKYFGAKGNLMLHHDAHQSNLLYFKVRSGGCALYTIGQHSFKVYNCGLYVTIYDYARATVPGAGLRKPGYDYLRLFSSHAGFLRDGRLSNEQQRDIAKQCLLRVSYLTGIQLDSERLDWDLSIHAKEDASSREICLDLMNYLEGVAQQYDNGSKLAHCTPRRRFVLR